MIEQSYGHTPGCMIDGGSVDTGLMVLLILLAFVSGILLIISRTKKGD